VLDDIVDHSYDNVEHNNQKFNKWLDCGLANLEKIKLSSIDYVRQRCEQAATHNQQLLQRWKLCWPVDFSNWLDNMLKVLHNTD
jgi:hypothetical protein